MDRALVLWRRMSTLEERWNARRNSFGLLRIAFALGVVFVHSWPIGFALGNPGYTLSREQSDFGAIPLMGLLVVSGFLNTQGAIGSTARKFAWRRFLRIFPGLWTSMIVTALVLAPLAALYENGTLTGFWTHSDGPFSYLSTNWLASMDQFPISGLLSTTPYGHLVGGPSAFAGSLWSLRYEFAAYVLLGIMIATGVIRKAPRVIPILLAAAYALVLVDLFTRPGWAVRPPDRGAIRPFPLLGSFEYKWALYLGFMFLLGATMRLYLYRIPVHGALAAVALALFAFTFLRGAYIAIGLPAFAYLVIYLAASLPDRLTRLARKRDYSFGVYIYGFQAQQIVALVGGAQFGIPVYIALCLVGTLALAIPSWHFVEHPALGLKNYHFAGGGHFTVASRRHVGTERHTGPKTVTMDGDDTAAAAVEVIISQRESAEGQSLTLMKRPMR